jgi:hypothetical protein
VLNRGLKLVDLFVEEENQYKKNKKNKKNKIVKFKGTRSLDKIIFLLK